MFRSCEVDPRRLEFADMFSAGAAGNFLASMDQLSANAFKSVMDIDVLGSYNMLKAVLPHLRKSAKAHVNDGKDSAWSNILWIQGC